MSLYHWMKFELNKTRTTLDDHCDRQVTLKKNNRLVKTYMVENNLLSPNKMVTTSVAANPSSANESKFEPELDFFDMVQAQYRKNSRKRRN
mmetsp:Transcript_21507/g.19076  ORF Transcript_21507/g.19076 Transcript_21507/m.19076 type:complete len:91 (+) Transcript_21507:471-743(+)